ncbi:hypothetical protein TSOC_004979, partial [Tetrabaena socialis]
MAEMAGEGEVSELDLERRRLMARNRAKLMALGIPVGIMELQDLAQQSKHVRARPKARTEQHPPLEPTRRSTRLAGGGAGAEKEEGLVQLGPEGAVEGQGAGERRRRHPNEGLTEEEIAARAEASDTAEQLRSREAGKLRELELEGLVDLSPEAAVFVVVGSTGNHYTVRLMDTRRSCNCMDCRIEKNVGGWCEAVERWFETSAGGGGAEAAVGGGDDAIAGGSHASPAAAGAGVEGKKAKGRSGGRDGGRSAPAAKARAGSGRKRAAEAEPTEEAESEKVEPKTEPKAEPGVAAQGVHAEPGVAAQGVQEAEATASKEDAGSGAAAEAAVAAA